MGGGASTATPKYKWDSDHGLKGPWTFLFKEKVQCACEGSRWCTRENPTKQKTANAIPGLHSSWVAGCVLAMARPWQSHVVQYKLVEAFKAANIGMILNLQEVGEHASCGPGNLAHCGFTYDPETFMAAGVGYYNFSWRDMGVPNLDRMMDIVQVMDYVTRVEGRKIAVHCHAGLGRTGLSIACFFVYTDMYDTPEEAIKAVRRDRAGAVQTSKQATFVTIFGHYLRHLRCLFVQRPVGDGSGRHGSGTGGHGHGAAGSLATKSAPPAAGGAEGLLPADGLVGSKPAGNTLVGTYTFGLTVVVPMNAGEAQPGGAGADVITADDLGLKQPLPWSDTFDIQPQYARDFVPRPPTTYTEALARQARLLHGPERRAFLKLHKLVKECIFAIMGAAETFQPPSAPQPAHPPPDPAAPPPAPAPHPPAPGAADPSGLPPTFAHALALLINHHSATNVDSPALEPLAAHAAYQHLTGTQVDSLSAMATTNHLRDQLNRAQYGAVTAWAPPGRASADGRAPQAGQHPQANGAHAAAAALPLPPHRAPLLSVLMVLEAFFANFVKSEEPASLTPECLKIIAGCYVSLFNSHVPPPPGSAAGSAANSANGHAHPTQPQTANGGAHQPQPPPTPGLAPLEVAKQAYEILEPLDPRDSELLLVFSALMRVVARVSGPGCEEAVVDIGKWAVGLLLGRVAHAPEAEEAVLSFLWYLAGRDEAFAMLLLLKRQRMAGQKRKAAAAGGGVDVAAMLHAAAALAQPPAAAAPPRPQLPAMRAPQRGPSGAQALPPIAEHGAAAAAGAEGPAAAPEAPQQPLSAYPPDSPHLLPALQLAQLLSQDIQQLYRVSFREAIAGISSVVYPPPPATGQIDIHQMWR